MRGGEEPILKRLRPTKIILEPPPCLSVCGVSRDVWWEYILKDRVLLVDLIAIKRTCKSFAIYKPLRWLIKAKVEAAFGDPKITPMWHWNRVRGCPYESHLAFVANGLANHTFVIFTESTINCQPYKRTYRLGVFSHKSALWKALLFLFAEYTFSQKGEMYDRSAGFVEMRFVHGIIYVRGIDFEEIKAFHQ